MAKQAKQTTDPKRQENALSFILYPLSLSPRQVLLLLVGMLFVAIEPALTLPKPDDTPEEVLRTEIITGARSPIDGKPISASEYAQLQAELQEPGPSRPVVGRALEKESQLAASSQIHQNLFPFLPVP